MALSNIPKVPSSIWRLGEIFGLGLWVAQAKLKKLPSFCKLSQREWRKCTLSIFLATTLFSWMLPSYKEVGKNCYNVHWYIPINEPYFKQFLCSSNFILSCGIGFILVCRKLKYNNNMMMVTECLTFLQSLISRFCYHILSPINQHKTRSTEIHNNRSCNPKVIKVMKLQSFRE